MHVQIITFQLQALSETDYGDLCSRWAPAIADLPGLLAHVWLADAPANTYGGVYLWRTRHALEVFAASDLFEELTAHPNLAGLQITSYAVLAEPTRITGGLVSRGV
jgi:heme-degrading monooxygenase HmoA